MKRRKIRITTEDGQESEYSSGKLAAKAIGVSPATIFRNANGICINSNNIKVEYVSAQT